MRNLTTDDTKRERIDGKAERTRAVTTNAGRGLTPAEYCVQNALAEEWQEFARKVAARVAKELPVWQKCDKCGFMHPREFRAAAGGRCIKCNFEGYKDGGFMRDLKPGEVKAWRAETSKKDAAALERVKRAGLYARNQERAKAGLEPLTAAEYAKNEAARAAAMRGEVRK